MNELTLNLTVAVDHELDTDGLAELMDQVKEHLELLYDEAGPRQSIFERIALSIPRP